MSVVNKLEQGRADFAFKKVKSIHAEKFASKYKSYVKSFPMMIKSNGLGSSLAFVFSKGLKESDEAKAYKQLNEHIQSWLTDQKLVALVSGEKLVEKIISLPSSEYRLITNEVLSYLNWLKRFAEGSIEKEDKGN